MIGMDLLATLTVAFALVAGLTTFLLARRDMRPAPAAGVAVFAALGTGAGFLFTVYLALFAFLGSVVVWQTARHFLVSHRAALLAGTAAYGIALVGSMTVMSYALSNM
jgi:hypothetical protein